MLGLSTIRRYRTILSSLTNSQCSGVIQLQQNGRNSSNLLKRLEKLWLPFSGMMRASFWLNSWNVGQQLQLLRTAKGSPNRDGYSKIIGAGSSTMLVPTPFPQLRRGFTIFIGSLPISHLAVPTLYQPTISPYISNSSLQKNA